MDWTVWNASFIQSIFSVLHTNLSKVIRRHNYLDYSYASFDLINKTIFVCRTCFDDESNSLCTMLMFVSVFRTSLLDQYRPKLLKGELWLYRQSVCFVYVSMEKKQKNKVFGLWFCLADWSSDAEVVFLTVALWQLWWVSWGALLFTCSSLEHI